MKRLALLSLLFAGCAPGSRFYQLRAGILHPREHVLIDLTLTTEDARTLGLSTGGVVTFCVHNGADAPEWWSVHVVGIPGEEP